jgi:hypothetical protein
MENKIVLELISKNLDEIKFLFETMLKEDKPDPLLIEITTLKTKTLYQELRLLLPKGSLIEVDETTLESELQPVADTIEENGQNEEEPESETVSCETTPIEEIIANNGAITETISNVEPAIVEETASVNEIAGIETSITEEFIQEETVAASQENIDDDVVPEEEVADLSSASLMEDEPVLDEPGTGSEMKGPHEGSDTPEEPLQATEIISETVAETTNVTEILKEETVKESTEKKVFGEQFAKEPSLNDKLASTNFHEAKIKAQPVESIKGTIGLNDRFLFTRELFGNDSARYESSIDHLDQLTTILEAIEFLEKNFQWTKNDASLKFMDLVKRRFEK